MNMKKKIIYVLVTVLLVVLNLGIAYTANAEEDAQNLTLNDALKEAFENSIKLKNDKAEIDKKDILFKDASDLVHYTPIDISYQPGDTNLFKYFYGSQFDKRKAEKQYENDKKQLIIDVENSYYSVIKAELAVEAANIAYQKSQIKFLQNQAKYKSGIITQADLISSEAQVAADKAMLADAKAKLDTAFGDLNKLLGAPVNKRWQLTDLPTVQKIELDTETQINLALTNSLEMWTAEEAARVQEQMKLFEKFYDVGDYNSDQAKNTAQDTRETIRKQVRSLCQTIEALYEKNDQLEAQIRQAEAALRVAEAQWKTGVITRDNVLTAQNAVVQAKAGQIEVASAYIAAVDTLKRMTGELDYNKKVNS